MTMIVVLGGTGKVGGTTIAALRQAGAAVRAVVRDAAKAGHLAGLGCEIAVADLWDVTALTRAMDGASTVQVICPVSAQGSDAAADMRRSIAALGDALEAARAPAILAISDYGAELSAGTGVTVLFHELEARLRRLPARLSLLRSAEHMENWSRVIRVAATTGALPSLHHPLTKLFPTVSAYDVGAVAADLLLAAAGTLGTPRVVHVEGPRRYSPIDVAASVSVLLGRDITAYALPRSEWDATLRKGGLSESYARLVIELYDAHNAGRIDAEYGVDEIIRGRTELTDALQRQLG
jgi:NAD(P)H dehydrogenase (quinone)